jgi:predicted nucleic acid-binding protein
MPWVRGVIIRLFVGPYAAVLMQKIADAGLLIAFFDRNDKHHRWAARVFDIESPPFHTAEPILAEAAAVLGTADDLLRMLELEDLVVSLELSREAFAIRTMMQRYKNRPMDLGDACCVRMAELLPGSVVYTVDRSDFTVYRKNKNQPVLCVFPD